MFRYLRIAVSVACLIACVLMLALWARSYSWADTASVRFAGSRTYLLQSIDGNVRCAISATRGAAGIHFRKQRPEIIREGGEGLPAVPGLRAARVDEQQAWRVVPHWFITALLALVATIPWLRWHFSLRILLVATTLVAVILGLFAWLAR